MADFSMSDLATSGVATQAIKESVHSQLPGRNNGPADAYRHLLLSAELTRQFGETYCPRCAQFPRVGRQSRRPGRRHQPHGRAQL